MGTWYTAWVSSACPTDTARYNNDNNIETQQQHIMDMHMGRSPRQRERISVDTMTKLDAIKEEKKVSQNTRHETRAAETESQEVSKNMK